MRLRIATAVTLGVFTGIVACGAAAAAPSADVYGAHAKMRNLTISPDGQHIAMITPNGDNDVAVILKVGGGICRVGNSTSKLDGVGWANNNRLIIAASRVAVGSTARVGPDHKLRPWGQLYTAKTDCSDIKKLNNGAILMRTPDDQLLMAIGMGNESTHTDVLLRKEKKSLGKIDIYKIDPERGRGEEYEPGADWTRGWIVDRDGKARIRIDADPRAQRLIYFARIGDSKDWVQIYDSRPVPRDQIIDFLAMANKPDTAYVMARNGGDRLGIYEFDLRSRAIGRPVLQHPRVDVNGLIGATYSEEVIGASYTDDYTTVEYVDRDFAQMQADLNATFPGEHSYVVSVSKDRKRYIAYVEGATNPAGIFYLVDMAAPAITKIGARFPDIKASDIGPVKSFTYTARDGASIPAYLTLPSGSSGKNLPLVVMPHGGPESRDAASFDGWAQFLASRGYAVLQPQYRGSEGFGASHRNAGRKQWGLRVQDDISDGVTQLIKQGVADSSRVCIVGWSFGGYATLAGLTFTPELYKCGVAGAGVSDLVRMLKWEEEYYYSWLGDNDYWTYVMGSLATDRERLAATSPANHADKVRAPLLLIHGRNDTTVPFEQSEIMAEALKKAGKPFEFVELKGETHYLESQSTSQQFLRELERFLGANLK